jgi:hypothetical protein
MVVLACSLLPAFIIKVKGSRVFVDQRANFKVTGVYKNMPCGNVCIDYSGKTVVPLLNV